MEFLNAFFPMLLYFLTTILLVILIILGLRVIRVIDKIEVLTNDISNKLKSLNAFFNVIDNFTDKISLISDKMILAVTTFLSTIFTKKRKDDNNE